MFSTNLIQSNYGDLNIKSLAFDSFKERLQSTMTGKVRISGEILLG